MLSLESPDRISVVFDDPRLVSNAGLILPLTLARRLGLDELVDSHLDLGDAPGRANPADEMLMIGDLGPRRRRLLRRCGRAASRRCRESAGWNIRCLKLSPPMVTPNPVQWVKSIWASRPGGCTCWKYTSLSGPWGPYSLKYASAPPFSAFGTILRQRRLAGRAGDSPQPGPLDFPHRSGCAGDEHKDPQASPLLPGRTTHTLGPPPHPASPAALAMGGPLQPCSGETTRPASTFLTHSIDVWNRPRSVPSPGQTPSG